MPAFCRVAATLKPTSDSDIKMEVWMPESGWNGKFQAVGNGGWAGAISLRCDEPGTEGAVTRPPRLIQDTQAIAAHSLLGIPEKVVDFGYRAVHEMTMKAKSIIEAFYGKGARISYWNGCSTGGRQGLKEVQRYPKDYDGVIAGAAANPTDASLHLADLDRPGHDERTREFHPQDEIRHDS